MIIFDKIYGEILIESKVLIDLINSKPVQRLKGISQFGLPDELNYINGYSRYIHSIGVMIFLKHLNASEQEQIAGLTHDVSHTAFSHIIDWVIGDSSKEDFQDNNHLKIIESSEIPQILCKYGYNYKKISKLNNFALLEKEIPELCVDRLDYSLRQLPLKKAIIYYNNLQAIENEIVFGSKELAIDFALDFLNLQVTHWSGYESTARYRLFSNILKLALNEKILAMPDFWLEEKHILEKLHKSKNQSITKALSLLRQKPLPQIDSVIEMAYKKFRYVDPRFIKNNKVYKVSETSNTFKQKIDHCRIESVKGITIPSFRELFPIISI